MLYKQHVLVAARLAMVLVLGLLCAACLLCMLQSGERASLANLFCLGWCALCCGGLAGVAARSLYKDATRTKGGNWGTSALCPSLLAVGGVAFVLSAIAIVCNAALRAGPFL